MGIKKANITALLVLMAGFSLPYTALGQKSAIKYRMALVLPFHSQGSNSSLTEATLDYMEGFKMAVNDLEKCGLQLDLHIFDCEKDSTAMDRILLHPDLAKMDVIVGPIYQENLEIMHDFCLKNNIILVSPLKYFSPNKFDSSTINFFIPDSLKTRCIGAKMGKIYNNYKFVIATDNSTKSKEYTKWLLQGLNLEKVKNVSIFPIAKNSNPTLKIKGDSIIVLSAINATSTKEPLLTLLKKRNNSYLLAHIDWHNSSTSTFEINEPKVIYPEINFVNASDTSTILFRDRFFEMYWGEPSKYAYIGYDQANYLCYELMAFGKSFNDHLPSADYRGLISVIHLTHTKNGIINTGLNYIQIIEEQRIELKP